MPVHEGGSGSCSGLSSPRSKVGSPFFSLSPLPRSLVGSPSSVPKLSSSSLSAFTTPASVLHRSLSDDVFSRDRKSSSSQS